MNRFSRKDPIFPSNFPFQKPAPNPLYKGMTPQYKKFLTPSMKLRCSDCGFTLSGEDPQELEAGVHQNCFLNAQNSGGYTDCLAPAGRLDSCSGSTTSGADPFCEKHRQDYDDAKAMSFAAGAYNTEPDDDSHLSPPFDTRGWRRQRTFGRRK